MIRIITVEKKTGATAVYHAPRQAACAMIGTVFSNYHIFVAGSSTGCIAHNMPTDVAKLQAEFESLEESFAKVENMCQPGQTARRGQDQPGEGSADESPEPGWVSDPHFDDQAAEEPR